MYKMHKHTEVCDAHTHRCATHCNALKHTATHYIYVYVQPRIYRRALSFLSLSLSVSPSPLPKLLLSFSRCPSRSLHFSISFSRSLSFSLPSPPFFSIYTAFHACMNTNFIGMPRADSYTHPHKYIACNALAFGVLRLDCIPHRIFYFLMWFMYFIHWRNTVAFSYSMCFMMRYMSLMHRRHAAALKCRVTSMIIICI